MFPFVRPMNIHPPMDDECLCYQIDMLPNSTFNWTACDGYPGVESTVAGETIYRCILNANYYFSAGDGDVTYYSDTCPFCGPTTTTTTSGPTSPPVTTTTTTTTTAPPSTTTTTTTTSGPTSPPPFFP